jgi:hypothetical protein
MRFHPVVRASLAALAMASAPLAVERPARADDDWGRIRMNSFMEEEFVRACPTKEAMRQTRDIGHSYADKRQAPNNALDLVVHGCIVTLVAVEPVSEEADLAGITTLAIHHDSKSDALFRVSSSMQFRYDFRVARARYFHANLRVDGKPVNGWVELFPQALKTSDIAAWSIEDMAAQKP